MRDTIKKHEDLVKKCIFSNGRCMTHYVKLDRTVKTKKYSVMDSNEKVIWRYRDVTCLVCPNQDRGGLVMDGDDTEISAAGGKKMKTED